MKILFKLFICSSLIWGCKTKPAAETKAAAEVKSTETEVFPYEISHPPTGYWQEGNAKDLNMVLTAFKGWETGNMDACMMAFSDSVRWIYSGFDEKFSHDSLRGYLTKSRGNMKAMNVKMDDFVHLISKDGKEQWVTLWYKQVFTTKKNKVDSVSCVDDIKIENGKIVLVDSKENRFPSKKAK